MYGGGVVGGGSGWRGDGGSAIDVVKVLLEFCFCCERVAYFSGARCI